MYATSFGSETWSSWYCKADCWHWSKQESSFWRKNSTWLGWGKKSVSILFLIGCKNSRDLEACFDWHFWYFLCLDDSLLFCIFDHFFPNCNMVETCQIIRNYHEFKYWAFHGRKCCHLISSIINVLDFSSWMHWQVLTKIMGVKHFLNFYPPHTSLSACLLYTSNETSNWIFFQYLSMDKLVQSRVFSIKTLNINMVPWLLEIL